jgi:hypothetical protein
LSPWVERKAAGYAYFDEMLVSKRISEVERAKVSRAIPVRGWHGFV